MMGCGASPAPTPPSAQAEGGSTARHIA